MQDKNKKRIYLGLMLLLAALLVIEICFAKPHHHMIWNLVPGADILLGFGGGWLLIFLAKGIMARLQQRREDYYDRDFAAGSSGQGPWGAGQTSAGGKGGDDHE